MAVVIALSASAAAWMLVKSSPRTLTLIALPAGGPPEMTVKLLRPGPGIASMCGAHAFDDGADFTPAIDLRIERDDDLTIGIAIERFGIGELQTPALAYAERASPCGPMPFAAGWRTRCSTAWVSASVSSSVALAGMFTLT
jgi:hypothetical protein